MSDENVLTKEIAEQFADDEDAVDLTEFTVIEDAAAASLGKHEGTFRCPHCDHSKTETR